MGLTHYWTGSVFVAEWTLTATGASVTGIVRQPPANSDAPMGADSTDDPTHKLSFQPTVPGRHVAVLDSAGAVVGREEVVFFVKREQLGLAPIELDEETDVGYCRTLVTDVDENDPLLSDKAYEQFLARNGNKVRLAAAAALDVIARTEALVLKKLTTTEMTTDGPAVAKELRESAAALRKEQKDLDDEADSDDFGLLVVPLASFPAAPYWGDWNL